MGKEKIDKNAPIPLFEVECMECYHPDLQVFGEKLQELDDLFEAALPEVLKTAVGGLDDFITAFRNEFLHFCSPYEPVWHSESDKLSVPIQLITEEDIGHPLEVIMTSAEQFSLIKQKLLKELYKTEKINTGENSCIRYTFRLLQHIALLCRYPHNRKVLAHHGIMKSTSILFTATLGHVEYLMAKNSDKFLIHKDEFILTTEIIKLTCAIWQQMVDPCYEWVHYLTSWKTREIEKKVIRHGNSIALLSTILDAILQFKVFVQDKKEESWDLCYSVLEELLALLGAVIFKNPEERNTFVLHNGHQTLLAGYIKKKDFMKEQVVNPQILQHEFKLQIYCFRLLHMLALSHPSVHFWMVDSESLSFITNLICWVNEFKGILVIDPKVPRAIFSCPFSTPYLKKVDEITRNRSKLLFKSTPDSLSLLKKLPKVSSECPPPNLPTLDIQNNIGEALAILFQFLEGICNEIISVSNNTDFNIENLSLSTETINNLINSNNHRDEKNNEYDTDISKSDGKVMSSGSIENMTVNEGSSETPPGITDLKSDSVPSFDTSVSQEKTSKTNKSSSSLFGRKKEGLFFSGETKSTTRETSSSSSSTAKNNDISRTGTTASRKLLNTVAIQHGPKTATTSSKTIDYIIISSILSSFQQKDFKSSFNSDKDSDDTGWTDFNILVLSFLSRMIGKNRGVVIQLQKMKWLDMLISPNFWNLEGCTKCGVSSFHKAVMQLMKYSAVHPSNNEKTEISKFIELITYFKENESCISEVTCELIEILQYSSKAQQKLLALYVLDPISDCVSFVFDSWNMENNEKSIPKSVVSLALLIEAFLNESPHNAMYMLAHDAMIQVILRALRKEYYSTDIRTWALRVIVTLTHLNPTPVQKTMENFFRPFISTFPSTFKENGFEATLDMFECIRLLVNCPHGSIVQQALVSAGVFTQIVTVLTYVPTNSEIDFLHTLLPGLFNTLTVLMKKNDSCKAKFEELVGYANFQKSILVACGGEVNQNLVDVMLDMLTARNIQDVKSPVSVHNIDILFMILNLLEGMPRDVQLKMMKSLTTILTHSYHNMTKACDANVVSALLRLISGFSEKDDIDYELLELIIELLEKLGSHSISPSELKLFFKTLKPKNNTIKPVHFFRLQQALQAISEKKGPLQCLSFNGENGNGIRLPTLTKLFSSNTGFSFITWIRIEKHERDGDYFTRLFSFRTENDSGVDCYVSKSNTLVYNISFPGSDKKHVVFSNFVLEYNTWYNVALTHVRARGLLHQSEVRLYVNGCAAQKAFCRFPVVNDPLTKCYVACKDFEDSQGGSALLGQLGTIFLFSDSFAGAVFKGIFELGPNYVLNFESDDADKFSPRLKHLFDGNLFSKLLINYNAKACSRDTLFNMAFTTTNSLFKASFSKIDFLSNDKRTSTAGTLHGYPCVTRSVSDSIRCLGGLQLLYLLIPLMDYNSEKKLMSETRTMRFDIDGNVFEQLEGVQEKVNTSKAEANQKDTDKSKTNPLRLSKSILKNMTSNENSNDLRPDSDFRCKSIEATSYTSKFLVILIDMLRNHHALQNTLLLHDGLGIIGILLEHVKPEHFDPTTALAILSLYDLILQEHTHRESNETEMLPDYLLPLYKALLFNFHIWISTNFQTQYTVLRLIRILLRKPNLFVTFRNEFPVSFFLDILYFCYGSKQTQYSYRTEAKKHPITLEVVGLCALCEKELALLRHEVLLIVECYVKEGFKKQELTDMINFVTVNEDEKLVEIILEFLLKSLSASDKKNGHVIETILELQNCPFQAIFSLFWMESLSLRLLAMRFILTLLTSDKVSEKNKKRIRLDEKNVIAIEKSFQSDRTITLSEINEFLKLACEIQTLDFSDVKLVTPEIILMVIRLINHGVCRVKKQSENASEEEVSDSNKSQVNAFEVYLTPLNYIRRIFASKTYNNVLNFKKIIGWDDAFLMLLQNEDSKISSNASMQSLSDITIDILDVLITRTMDIDPNTFQDVTKILHMVRTNRSLNQNYTRQFCQDLVSKLLSTIQSRVNQGESSDNLNINMSALLPPLELFLFHRQSMFSKQNKSDSDISNENDSWSDLQLGLKIIDICTVLGLRLKDTNPMFETKTKSGFFASSNANPGPNRFFVRLLGILIKDPNSAVCEKAVRSFKEVLQDFVKANSQQKKTYKSHREELLIIFGRIYQAILMSFKYENEHYKMLFPLFSYFLKEFVVIFDYEKEKSIKHEFEIFTNKNSSDVEKLNMVNSDVFKKLIEEQVTSVVELRQAAEYEFFINTTYTWAVEFDKTKKDQSMLAKKKYEENVALMNSSFAVHSELIHANKERLDAIVSQLKNKRDTSIRSWRSMLNFFTSERGALGTSTSTYWKLDRTETSLRTRPKLANNYNFTIHVEASKYRDEGTITNVKNDEANLEKIIAKGAVVGMDELSEDQIDESEWNSLNSEIDRKMSVCEGDDVFYDVQCELVTLMTITKGRLKISMRNIYFYADRTEEVNEHLLEVVDVAPRDYKWPVQDIRQIHFRRYLLRRSALEIFLVDQKNYFLNFDKQDRNKVYSKILHLRPPNLIYSAGRSPAELFKHSDITGRWQRHEISNFEYLMHLNTISGRTYNDLSQYPVFPWILTDYSSKELDLTNENVYRDLSKPIGVQNPEKGKDIAERYENFEDPTGTIRKFHYGTHYSTSASVLYYLLRVEPFTTLHIYLQGGKFDIADRQFSSIEKAWKSVYTTSSDVKELIPEFFYSPEFLINQNKFDLGVTQTGTRIGDIELPPWAKSPQEFIRKNREALESEYVSANLHHWIDLIFGYKQKGEEAIKNLNVFYHTTYEGAINLDSITDPAELEAVQSQIINFGQTPSQLLQKPHPARLSIAELSQQSFVKKSSLAMLNYYSPETPLYGKLYFTKSLRAFFFQVYEMQKEAGQVSEAKLKGRHVKPNELHCLEYVHFPKKQVLQTGGAEKIVTVSRDACLAYHSWINKPQPNGIPFMFERDTTTAYPDRHRYVGTAFDHEILINHKLFDVSADGKLFFSGGHWNNSIKVSSIDSKALQSVNFHSDVVTCVKLDSSNKFLIVGSRDTTATIWRVDINSNSGTYLEKSPSCILYGHDSTVNCVDINHELDIAVTGSEDGTIIIHTIRQGSYVRTLTPPCPGHCELSFLPPISEVKIVNNDGGIFVSTQTTKGSGFQKEFCGAYMFNCNGMLYAKKEMSAKINQIIASGDGRTIILASTDGSVRLLHDLTLKEYLKFDLNVDVKSVALMPTEDYLLAGLADGKLIFITVGS